MADYFGTPKYPKNLDYISLWFLKAADWLANDAQVGFVSTNSICQGTHIEMVWPRLLDRAVKISFAHTSFLWSNQAQRNAGVTCVVIGISEQSPVERDAILFDDGTARRVANINPYLAASKDNTLVLGSPKPLTPRPAMKYGSKPSDGGHLVLTRGEFQELSDADPRSRRFVKEYIGAKELMEASKRFCLWIEDEHSEEANQVSEVMQRIQAVARFRSSSKAASTREWAAKPHRFKQVGYEETPCIAVPRHSSERREYIPMGYYPTGTVISDACFAIYGAEPWLLAIIQSSMHMAWVRTIAGRLESRFRYSNTLCYNAYPFPVLDHSARSDLTNAALGILGARERWPDRSPAELYDPDAMPANLRAAHKANDELVDHLYRSRTFSSDSDRMELLMARYRELLAPTAEVSS